MSAMRFFLLGLAIILSGCEAKVDYESKAASPALPARVEALESGGNAEIGWTVIRDKERNAEYIVTYRRGAGEVSVTALGR